MPSSHASSALSALEALQPIHFIGIAGSGMHPLAAFCSELGIKVTGSDLSNSFQEFFQRQSIRTTNDHNTVELVSEASTVIYSSAIHSSNPEYRYAQTSGKTILHRSDLLALISENYRLITVSGTHGKSTTSALISYLLSALETSPSYILGAPFRHGNGELRAYNVGIGPWLVIESDESDGSFLKYRPEVAVITSIDLDHLDYYKNQQAIVDAFANHASMVEAGGQIVLFWDNENVRMLQPTAGTSKYGEHPDCDFRIVDYMQMGLMLKYKFQHKDTIFNIQLPLIGFHNALNATAALAVIKHLQIDMFAAISSLKAFGGISRRLERIYSDNNISVYDDYAHNPVKISSCLKGLRMAFPQSHIIAVFQPHRYTRTLSLFDDFSNSFHHANTVIVCPLYAAGEPDDPRYSTGILTNAISSSSGVACFGASSLTDANNLVQSYIPQHGKHCVVVTIGAGDVWKVTRGLYRLE
jgi:UDP-N-acetylmuramate--alanine ligase